MSQNAALPAAVATPTPEGPPLHVIGHVHAFGMAGQRLDAAQLGLGEKRIIGEAVVRSMVAMALAPRRKPMASIGSIATCGIDIIALVAAQLEFALHRLAQHHPQRVAGGHASGPPPS